MNSQMQVSTPQNFFDESRLIAERFIQTVVAVDDNISFGQSPKSVMNSDLQVQLPDADSGLGTSNTTIDELSLDTPDSNNDLNYQELSACFADKSILCSALKVYEGDNGEQQTIDATFNISKKADITILDWQMESDPSNYGNIATGVINQLLKYDLSNNGCLRLILIYTSAPIIDIIRDLLAKLKELQPVIENETSISFINDSLKLCRIFVINKTENIQLLVDTSIQKFTEMTCGLLSNATLAAITEIRDKTHHHLYTFNKNLDTAYLSHVLSLISSADMRESSHDVAFDYAVDLISEEIKSKLQTSQIVKNSLNRECLQKWPYHVNPENQNTHSFNVLERPPFTCDNERMEKFLTVIDESELIRVLDEEPKYPGGINKFKGQYIQFQLNGSSEPAHLELSAIECLRRDMINVSDTIPVLKQGSVIKKNDDYFVCIQPICDSVRLTEPTNFLFLKARQVGGAKFSHVVRQGVNQYQKIQFKGDSKLVCLMTFNPVNKMIRAKKEADKFIFESANNEKFEWCGEFKQTISQEIVNGVSASIARVGFDSFEWLRLRKP